MHTAIERRRRRHTFDSRATRTKTKPKRNNGERDIRTQCERASVCAERFAITTTRSAATRSVSREMPPRSRSGREWRRCRLCGWKHFLHFFSLRRSPLRSHFPRGEEKGTSLLLGLERKVKQKHMQRIIHFPFALHCYLAWRRLERDGVRVALRLLLLEDNECVRLHQSDSVHVTRRKQRECKCESEYVSWRFPSEAGTFCSSCSHHCRWLNVLCKNAHLAHSDSLRSVAVCGKCTSSRDGEGERSAIVRQRTAVG